MSHVRPLSTAAFDAEVLQSPGPVLIDFWAPWCGPCRAMKPILEEAAKTLGEAVDVRTVNVEDEPELAGAFGIRGVPTVVVLRDGRPVDAWMGVLPAEQIVRRLEEKLGLPVRVGGAG